MVDLLFYMVAAVAIIGGIIKIVAKKKKDKEDEKEQQDTEKLSPGRPERYLCCSGRPFNFIVFLPYCFLKNADKIKRKVKSV